MDQKKVDSILSMVDCFQGENKEKKAASKRSFIETIKRILPAHIENKERFALMFEEVVNAKLRDSNVADKSTVLPCVFQSAKFGLYPDPAMGQIYFIPYKGKLTYQLGYKGMIRLCKNGGEIVDVAAELVYKKEVESNQFNYFIDEKGQHFYHKPIFEKERGPRYCGYSYITLKDGKVFFHLMEESRIQDIKKMVLARTPGSPWATALFEPEMAKKTVIRRHCKTLDISPDLRIAIEQEEAVERGEEVKYSAKEIEEVMGDIISKQSGTSQAEEDDSMVPIDQQELPFKDDPPKAAK